MTDLDLLASIEDSTVVATGADAWVLGGFVELVPANTITSQFELRYLSIKNLDHNTIYEIVLYAIEGEIARIRVAKNENINIIITPTRTITIAANSQIQARAASKLGGSVVTLGGVLYYEYERDKQ